MLYLVDKLPPEGVVFFQNVCPELRVLPAHQIASLALEQRVLIADLREKLQTLVLELGVSATKQVWLVGYQTV